MNERKSIRGESRKKSLTESSYLENLKNCEGTVELIEGVSLNFMIKLPIG